MKKRHLVAIIAFLAFMSVSFVKADLVCGHAPDSLLGYGQVDISGIIISCNNIADSICPEDYEDYNNASIYASCLSCSDPDCIGTVRGVVRSSAGFPVERALVTSHPIRWNTLAPSLETSTFTDILGRYTLSTVSGVYYVSALKEGFDTELKLTSVLRNQNTNQDFNLLNGTCHEDCTNSYGRCSAACDGLTFENATQRCKFFDSNTRLLCNNRMKGSSVFNSIYNDTHAYFIECCESAPELKYYSKVNINSADISDLVKIEKIARYNEIPVKVIIAYWY